VEKTIGEIITQHGYTFEEHTVQTSDGYDLTLHRIKGSGKPVLMMHGMPGASSDYIVNEKEKAPAFVLAAEGYDVWLGNNRGGYYTQTHKTLNIMDAAFWHYTGDEIGVIDTAALIQKVLTESGASKLAAYVGHSYGTVQFFTGASLDPDWYESRV
jgi:lysosomal acid lipase/cholesteryl ester hydrolase